MTTSESESRAEATEAAPELLKASGRVLSTLENDGSRRWIKPRLSAGSLHTRRMWFAAFLIFVFTVLPFVKVGGRPLLLIDILNREFIIFGLRLLPTDTLLMALLMVSTFLGIFFFTALFGRVWCGWACPQTVYMEFVFRPIERLFEGTWGRGGAPRGKAAGWKTAAKFAVYFVISFYLAHTFLAYFVGVDKLITWIWRSTPLEHPIAFGIIALVTVAMLFDFGYFREQTCIIACPYGRFQSVLLDRQSSIVAYHAQRGEPRGKLKKKSVELPILAPQGDCIDCGNCVTTCPTGIDIRDGLQLECINCTQCIDACDAVMTKIGKPTGLIRYSSQARDEGERRHLIRPRIIVYPLILTVLLSVFGFLVVTRKSFEGVMLRNPGLPFQVEANGEVVNSFRLALTNRSDQADTIRITGVEPSTVRFELTTDSFDVPANGDRTEGIRLFAPKNAFVGGRLPARILLESSRGDKRAVACTIVGP